MSTKFFNNQGGNTLFTKFKGIAEGMGEKNSGTKSPVPSFVVFDQPSQVYFPHGYKDVSEFKSEFGDVDTAAVRKMFDTISRSIQETGGAWQTIVLEHADYHGRQGIVIDKYLNRIEVSNPGILRISKAVAVAGGTSDARNAKIFNIFSLVKIGERSGMGLSQLFGNWEEAGYARPQLSESFSPERTKVEIEVVVAEKRGEVAEKVAEKLSETEERIVALIRANPHITQRMLSDAIGLTRQYVGRCMDSLQTRKIIRRVGPDKGGYWEVLSHWNT